MQCNLFEFMLLKFPKPDSNGSKAVHSVCVRGRVGRGREVAGVAARGENYATVYNYSDKQITGSDSSAYILLYEL